MVVPLAPFGRVQPEIALPEELLLPEADVVEDGMAVPEADELLLEVVLQTLAVRMSRSRLFTVPTWVPLRSTTFQPVRSDESS